MEFKGFTCEIKDDRLILHRKKLTEAEKPNYSDFKNNELHLLFERILRVSLGRKNNEDAIAFNYVNPTGSLKCPRYEPTTYSFVPLPSLTRAGLEKLVKCLNLALFGHPSPSPKRFKIIINPKSGKGKAREIFRRDVLPILQYAGCNVVENIPEDRAGISHCQVTTGAGKAVDIVKQMVLENYDGIMCVGGDGIVHEVINGLARREDACDALFNLPIATIPAGTGNALAVSLFGDCDPTYAAWQAVRFRKMPADLMSVTPVDGMSEPLWSFLSVAYGWIAHADIDTEKLRFIGDARFTLGVVLQMAAKKGYTCSVAIYGHLLEPDTVKPEIQRRQEVKEAVTRHYVHEYQQSGGWVSEFPQGPITQVVGTKRPVDKWHLKTYTNLFSFYAGKLPWMSRTAYAFPAALSNDGYIDLCILEGDVGRKDMIKIFNGFDKGHHYHHPSITYMKVKSFKLLPGVSHNGPDPELLRKSVKNTPPDTEPLPPAAAVVATDPDVLDPSPEDIDVPADGPPAATIDKSSPVEVPVGAETTSTDPEESPDLKENPNPQAHSDPKERSQRSVHIGPVRRTDVDTNKFKKRFAISIDGERFDPGHGIVCEVHQGLASFVADSKVGKYQPTMLLDSKAEQPADASKVWDENAEKEATLKLKQWMNEMEEQLKAFEDEDEEDH